eukprot:3651391-Lingulodinium_polyedra.AAC.1
MSRPRASAGVSSGAGAERPSSGQHGQDKDSEQEVQARKDAARVKGGVVALWSEKADIKLAARLP